MDWTDFITLETEKEYYKLLNKKIENTPDKVFPVEKDIFNAFRYCSFSNTRVVILGQDPYHSENQAHGLSFSINNDGKIPPSLKNIFKELKDDVGTVKLTGDLTSWAKQGVLMLNSVLTVSERKPNSHKGWGWEKFTDNVISHINENKEDVVFILWGKNAEKKTLQINTKKHKIIRGCHPSPLSANRGGFFGTKPFSTCNSYLEKNKIEW